MCYTGEVIDMKIKSLCSIEVKNVVKMCAAISFVLACFIKRGISHFYDIIFPVVFIYLIIKFYSIND